jgi:hypothetical protein
MGKGYSMNQGNTLLWGGLICGTFVAVAVFLLGGYLEESANLAVRVLFAIGFLASLVFLFSYIAGMRRKKD